MTPRNEYVLPLEYLAFCADQRLQQVLTNMLQMKVCICCKTLSNRTGIQECIFKPETEDALCYCSKRSKENYKVTKALRVKCAPITGTAKGISMAHNKICLLFRDMGTWRPAMISLISGSETF